MISYLIPILGGQFFNEIWFSYFVVIWIVVDCPRRRWYGCLKLVIVPISIILIQQRISVYYSTGKNKNRTRVRAVFSFEQFNNDSSMVVWINICLFKCIWCVMPVHICWEIVKLVWNSVQSEFFLLTPLSSKWDMMGLDYSLSPKAHPPSPPPL